jgi:hypothetical protein
MNKKEEASGVKMFFTERIRYPLHEDIYAEAGSQRIVDEKLVQRMLKRGARVVDEAFKAEEKEVVPEGDTITTPETDPNAAPLDKTLDDDGADLLGSEEGKKEDPKKDGKKDAKNDGKKDAKKH